MMIFDTETAAVLGLGTAAIPGLSSADQSTDFHKAWGMENYDAAGAPPASQPITVTNGIPGIYGDG